MLLPPQVSMTHNLEEFFVAQALVRESSAYLQTARQLQALVGGVTGLGPINPLFALERAMGVAQVLAFG